MPAAVKSIRITTGNGIILPAKPGIAYQVYDFSLDFATTALVALFFGNTYNDDAEFFFSSGNPSGEVATIFGPPIKDNPDFYLELMRGGEKQAVGIYTSPTTSPTGISFLRYKELVVG